MVPNHPLQDIIVGAEGSSGSPELAPKPKIVFQGMVEGKTTRVVVAGAEVYVEVSSRSDLMGAPIFEVLNYCEDSASLLSTFKALARAAVDMVYFPY